MCFRRVARHFLLTRGGSNDVWSVRTGRSSVGHAIREDIGDADSNVKHDYPIRTGELAKRHNPPRVAANLTAHVGRVELEMLPERLQRLSLNQIVRDFAPNWFTITMGTGAVPLALNQFPFAICSIRDFAGGLWLLNILVFMIFIVIYAA